MHPRRSCFELAVKRGLARSARARIHADVDTLLAELAEQATRRATGLLAAAQRARHLAIGSAAVQEAAQRGEVSLMVVAGDAAAAAHLGEVLKAQEEGRAIVWTDKATLGAIFGRGEVGVVAVTDDGIASALRRATAAVSPGNASTAPGDHGDGRIEQD